MQLVSANKCVKFQIKILSGCWENSDKLWGATFFAAPCTTVNFFE